MNNNTLAEKLARINEAFSIDSILNREANDPIKIAKYYHSNRLAYSLLNSRHGFVHMGISRNGEFKESDFFEQGNTIKPYIEKTNASHVLELAPGKAATTKYLADAFPKTTFYGVDLPNGQLDVTRYNDTKNLVLSFGDYHDLSKYDTDSLDIVYVIEALCHAKDRGRVLSEVHRILKPGGYFIVFDGYYAKPEVELSDDEKLAARLLFKSMMVTEENHYYPDFIDDLAMQRFTVVQEDDLSEAVMPSLLRLEKMAQKYIHHPKFANITSKFIPEEILGNAIAGYLFPATMRAGIFAYWLTVSQKR